MRLGALQGAQKELVNFLVTSAPARPDQSTALYVASHEGHNDAGAGLLSLRPQVWLSGRHLRTLTASSLRACFLHHLVISESAHPSVRLSVCPTVHLLRSCTSTRRTPRRRMSSTTMPHLSFLQVGPTTSMRTPRHPAPMSESSRPTPYHVLLEHGLF